MAEANNRSEYFITPRGLMSVISPESMSQDCYLWSSVFYSHLFIKFEYLNFPEVWSLSFPPNPKNSPNVFVHSWHFKGLVWLNAHSLTQDSDLHGNVIGVIPKMTRGTLTFIIIFVRDSISIHDLMSLRALCFKLMYRQCYLSMDWRRCWQEQTELLFGFFLVTFFVGGNLSNFLFAKDAHQWSSSVTRCNDSSTNWISVKRMGAAGPRGSDLTRTPLTSCDRNNENVDQVVHASSPIRC